MILKMKCKPQYKAIKTSLNKFKVVIPKMSASIKKKLMQCRNKFKRLNHRETRCYRKRKLCRMKKPLSSSESNNLKLKMISSMRILNKFRDKWVCQKHSMISSRLRWEECMKKLYSSNKSCKTEKTLWDKRKNR